MYSKYGLGLNSLTARGDLVKQAISNAHKTAQVVKTEIQLAKMTNLLKTINTENNYLSNQLIKLTDQNKELKKVLTLRGGRITPGETQKDAEKDYHFQAHNRKEMDGIIKPVVADHYMNSKRLLKQSENSDTARFGPSRISMARQFKSTQTSPPRQTVRPPSHQVAISTEKTPQKYKYSQNANYNPQTTHSGKKERVRSIHKIAPSSFSGIKQPSFKSSQSLNSQTVLNRASIIQRESLDGSGRKRFLSLVSLKK